MKTALTMAIIGSISFSSLAHMNDNQNEYASSPKTISTESYAQKTQPDFGKGITRHIVLFDLKEDVTQSQKQEIVNRFLALKNSKRNGEFYIESIEVGVENISKEGQGKGYDLAFIVSFTSKGNLNYYVGTPAISDSDYFDNNHQKFKGFVGPLLKVGKNSDGSDYVGVLVFDYQF